MMQLSLHKSHFKNVLNSIKMKGLNYGITSLYLEFYNKVKTGGEMDVKWNTVNKKDTICENRVLLVR